jgi:hypothetical protein
MLPQVGKHLEDFLFTEWSMETVIIKTGFVDASMVMGD